MQKPMLFILILLTILPLSGCNEIKISLEDQNPITSDDSDSGGGNDGPGGDCSVSITFSEQQPSDPIGVTINGYDGTFTLSSGSTTEEDAFFDADSSHPSATSNGITYVELTYTGNSGGVDSSSYISVLFADVAFGNVSVLRIFPGAGKLTRNSTSDNIITGLTINPGYTVGFWLDHSTGETFYKDSLGNSSSIETVAGLSGTSVITGMAGKPLGSNGASISGTLNVGTTSYDLSPPTSALDWCGNSL